MSIFDAFKSKPAEDDFDPLNLSLKNLKPGYFFDYDMKTWQVTAYHRYDYGDGVTGKEWEIQADGKTLFLGYVADEEVYWTLSKKLPLGAIEGDVAAHILQHEDPPKQILVKGKRFYADESGSAYFFKNGRGPAVGFITWDYIDDDDENFVTIEQWGEEDFEAWEGTYVEEYQFSDILPGDLGPGN